ncbi:MAG: HigA family addiction module antitoxin [Gammaproteobacteria bacterium]
MRNATSPSHEAPIHPGEYLERHVLKPKGISKNELAERLGVTRQTVSKIVNGHTNLSSKLAMQLAAVSDEPASFWMKLANDYAIWEQQADHQLDETPENELHLIDRWSALGPRVLTDREIVEAVKAGYIGIEPFSMEGMRPTASTLHLGEEVATPSGIECLDEHSVLEPHRVVFVRTKETIRIPSRVTANFSPKSHLSREGVFFSMGNIVDPGFNGPLFLTVENRGHEAVKFTPGIPILRIQFHYLASEPRRYREISRDDFADYRARGLSGLSVPNQSSGLADLNDEELEAELDRVMEERTRRRKAATKRR